MRTAPLPIHRVTKRMLGFGAALMATAFLRAESPDPPAPSTPVVHALDFAGNRAVSTPDLQKHLSLQPGEPYKPEQLQFSVDVIEARYRDHGYADVKISTRVVTLADDRINIAFEVHEGPQYHIGAVRTQGNRHITKAVIQRELGISPGDVFSPARIYDGNKQLFLSGYFEAVEIHYSTAPMHQMDIAVHVKERPTKYLKGGGGYGVQTKERLSAGYEDVNFFGNARRLDVTGTFSGFATHPEKYQTTNLQVNLAQPYLFGTRWAGQTNVSREWDKREGYHAAVTAWQSSIDRRLARHLTAILHYRYSGTSLNHVDSSLGATAPSFTNISAAGPGFSYDNTDDPFLPTHGWRITSTLEKGLTWGVGDLRFYKGVARVGRYDPLFGRLTFFFGLQGGLLRPDDPKDTMPIYEEFYLGGADTVRGYEERELGPKDAVGNPLGGAAFTVANLELRHPLYKKLFGVVFLDGGQLWGRDPGANWPHVRVTRLDDLAWGTGTGIRLQTPVGAVRLEVGYELDPPPGSGTGLFRRTAIHFSLGENF